MTMARDRTAKKKVEVECCGVSCPCRPCWRPHDCGQRTTIGHWMPRMACATWFGGRCPVNGWNATPASARQVEPKHDFGKRRQTCRRCGTMNPPLATNPPCGGATPCEASAEQGTTPGAG